MVINSKIMDLQKEQLRLAIMLGTQSKEYKIIKREIYIEILKELKGELKNEKTK